MKAIITAVILMIYASYCFAQSDAVFIVTAEKLNVRSGPGTDFEIVQEMYRGQEVIVVDNDNVNWYKIQVGNEEGYVYSKFIEHDLGWSKEVFSTGDDPECDNIIPEYDRDIDNYLEINVGSNTDVVVKIMKLIGHEKDLCVRIVYIRSNDTFKIINIPEGKYYLKIAYGKDWRQKIVEGKCYGKFMRSSIYEKGDEILDFNRERTPEGYSIPIYTLSLDVIETYQINNFSTNTISEQQFNN